MGTIVNRTGMRYGQLTVDSMHKLEKGKTYWKCICDCGNTTTVSTANLIGSTKSCGCLKRLGNRKKHGESRTTKEYNTWAGMIERCYTIGDQYDRYGGRGITVCNRWLNSFENFLADMGRAPSKQHSIDRKENDGNYEPGNCRWATKKEQANNRITNILIKHNGETKTLKQWCEFFGLEKKYPTIRKRIRQLHWSPQKAFSC